MTLRIVNVPNPGAGVDWQTVVPGQYLYNVTGITATLTTQPNTATVAHDASGNGHDGAYTVIQPPQTFAAGIVAGDTALETGLSLAAGETRVDIPTVALDMHHAWSFVWWATCSDVTNPQDDIYIEISGLAAKSVEILTDKTSKALTVSSSSVGAFWSTANNTVPYDGTGHMWAVTWDGATLTAYKDGAVIAWAHTGVPGAPSLVPDRAMIGANVNGTPEYVGILDEFALWNATVLTAGQIAALHTAGLAGFATYRAAVLALNPYSYYHLNDGANIGRQVALEITDGHTVVELIPSGFAVAAVPGPYGYSWQPGLAASTQSSAGVSTTVAIPALILPAGYTIGARTLDLFAFDAWSNIVVWWNDDVMNAQTPLNPYVFPPSVHLVYEQRVPRS